MISKMKPAILYAYSLRLGTGRLSAVLDNFNQYHE